MHKKAFVSWSGGKDCTLALHTFLEDPRNRVEYLVHIQDPKHGQSVEENLLQAQAEVLDIPLILKIVELTESYESVLKGIISLLKTKGITCGIFGDIHLQDHRDWIERVCKDMEIEAIFPLWKQKPLDILNHFVNSGFKSIVTSTNGDESFKALKGRTFDGTLLQELTQMEGIDLCGENGEYHTFVIDAPLFKQAISASLLK